MGILYVQCDAITEVHLTEVHLTEVAARNAMLCKNSKFEGQRELLLQASAHSTPAKSRVLYS